MTDPAPSCADRPCAPRPGASLAVVRQRVAGIEGWLTDAQVDRLHRAAAATPPGGRVVEIGSFRGRSTVVLASSVATGTEVVAVDPHAGNDRGPREIEGYEAEAATDHEVFCANLAAAGVAGDVRHVRKRSADAHDAVADPIDVLFIDGAHRFGPARADLRDWGRRVAPGGRLLVHDAFSSVGVTLAILVELVGRRDWRYEGRSGSLAEYRRTRQTLGARATSAVAQAAQLGWFARNLVIKALIVAGLGRFARSLGHRQQTWPY